MDLNSHNKLVSFIWSIADDVLRDIYVRGKYRDVILPMLVLRRLDALLVETKKDVLEEINYQKNELKLDNIDSLTLSKITGYPFFNTSQWTLELIKTQAVNSSQILVANFEDYINGFSDNVKEIIDKFKLRQQIIHMADKDVLLDIIERFTSPYINLTPNEITDPEGRKLPGLSNLGMGYVFEELIRKFNEENNEEAGEHFTPREVIKLMTNIIFEPIKDKLPPVITVYDPACGSGGMLTESQNFIKDEEGNIKSNSDVYLFGKEINDETYAICKSDMMIKGNDPKNIRNGSTLSTDEFSGQNFNFMLSNPPYGKSWATEVKYIKDGKQVIDSRFTVSLKDYWGIEEIVDATPRTSDGQLLFLMEMIDKMKPLSIEPLGSRIASVHNGSSLFTGDAGGGESNIRRYIIENDMLDCIVQLPTNLFYNTGITTYIWILTNNKSADRKGKVILIDASKRFSKLRKNLGQKNCELTDEHISEILNTYHSFKNVDSGDDGISAMVFDNSDFGYFKATIERPKRLKSEFTSEKIQDLRYDKSLLEPLKWAYNEFGEDVYVNLDKHIKSILKWCEDNGIDLNSKNKKSISSLDFWLKYKETFDVAKTLCDVFKGQVYSNFNTFTNDINEYLKSNGIKIASAQLNQILSAVSEYDENADKVVKKVQKFKEKDLSELINKLGCNIDDLPDFGYNPTGKKNEYTIYEADTELRDSETVALNDNIHDYYLREVKPHVEEAWIDLEKTKIGYEISFNKYFYKHKPLRNIEEVTSEILNLEKENEGLIMDILGVS